MMALVRVVAKRLAFRNVNLVALAKAVGAAIATGGIRIASAAVTLGFSIFGARLLGEGPFGSYVSIMAAAGLGSVLLSAGVPQLIEREIAAARGGKNSERIIPLVHFVALLLPILVAATLFAWIFVGGYAGFVVLLVTLTATATILAAIHTGFERVLFAAWSTNIIKPALSLLALLGFAFVMMPSAMTAVAAQLVGVCATMAIFAIGFFRREKKRAWIFLSSAIRDYRPTSLHRELFFSALTLAGVQVVINATTQLDILAVTALLSPSDVAHYYAATRAATMVSVFYGASLAMASPAITRLVAAKDNVGLDEKVRQTTLVGAGLTAGAGLCGILISWPYLSFYGPDYTQALPAMVVLLIGFASMSCFGPALTVLVANRKERIVLGITILALLSNALLAILLIPKFGIAGAAIGTACQMLIYMGGQSIACHLLCGVRTDIFSFYRPTSRQLTK